MPDARAFDAAARYLRCEALVVRLEGAYVDNPCDKGGPTKWGVTQRALEAWRGHACAASDVAALTPVEVAQIYHGPYWGAVHGDTLPAGVDLITFDAAVNCGRGRAVGFLQAGLRLAADGDFGSGTLAALAACEDRVGLITRIRVARAHYYAGLPRFAVFGRGWLARLRTVSLVAQTWAQPSSQPLAAPDRPQRTLSA